MSESKLRQIEIDAIKANEAGQRAAAAHVAQTAKVPSSWVNQVSVGMTMEGNLRLTYGEVIHPSVPPQFHGALTMPMVVGEAIADIILKVTAQHKATMAATSEPVKSEARITSYEEPAPSPGEVN